MSAEFKKMLEFFETYEPTDEYINLDECTVVLDQKRFIESHTYALLKNSGNRLYKPYYDRLKIFYNKVNKQKP